MFQLALWFANYSTTVIVDYLLQGAWDTENCPDLMFAIWFNFSSHTMNSTLAVDLEPWFRFSRQILDLGDSIDDGFNKKFIHDALAYIRFTNCRDYTTLNGVCRFLISIGADLESRNGLGETALLALTWPISRLNTVWLQVLVDNGANCFATDTKGRSAVHLALRSYYYTSLSSSFLACVTRIYLVTLLRAGCSPHGRDTLGITPSDCARESGKLEIWKEALQETGLLSDELIEGFDEHVRSTLFHITYSNGANRALC